MSKYIKIALFIAILSFFIVFAGWDVSTSILYTQMDSVVMLHESMPMETRPMLYILLSGLLVLIVFSIIDF